jgi:hypothetical protein
MTRFRVATFLLIALIAALLIAACGGDDDNATKTPGATATAQQSTSSSKTATATPKQSSSATTAAASKTAGAGSSSGNVYDVSSGDVPFEVCDVFTAQVVADALNETASDFENNSFGKQIPPEPFVTGEQCEWKNYTSGNGDSASLNASFTATADEAMSQIRTDCQGQESVDVGADAACYPELTGQLRAVKGNVYMVFATGLAFDTTVDIPAAEKQMAEQTIANLP